MKAEEILLLTMSFRRYSAWFGEQWVLWEMYILIWEWHVCEDVEAIGFLITNINSNK